MPEAFFARFGVNVEKRGYGILELVEAAFGVLAESRLDYAGLDWHCPVD